MLEGGGALGAGHLKSKDEWPPKTGSPAWSAGNSEQQTSAAGPWQFLMLPAPSAKASQGPICAQSLDRSGCFKTGVWTDRRAVSSAPPPAVGTFPQFPCGLTP